MNSSYTLLGNSPELTGTKMEEVWYVLPNTAVDSSGDELQLPEIMLTDLENATLRGLAGLLAGLNSI